MKVIRIEISTREKDESILFEQSTENKNQYIAEENQITIEVETDAETGGRRSRILICNPDYEEYQQEILGLFENKYEELQRTQQENYESGFENIEEEEEATIKSPYNPNLITVAPAKFSLKEIVGMIDGEEGEEPDLDLAPDFQRDYVWDNTRKSRLIESILLNIPLPVFYLARDKNGKIQVVDGVQRLTTIYKFFKNEFKLNHLEYLEDECGGRYFKKNNVSDDKNLQPKLVRALRQYQIDCNIIEPSTPENVKLDIFKRLNTGGKSLNKQEVRHAFMKKDVRNFVRELVTTPEFECATDGSINDKRMMAQELVLRYIGFYSLYIDDFMQVEYSTKMDEFLDNVAVTLNCCKNIPYNDIREHFRKAMINASIMFDRRAFRKIEFTIEGEISQKKNPINKSLFIAFAVLLSGYSCEAVEKRGNVSREFAEYLSEDGEFYYSISHNTNYQLRETAIVKVQKFLTGLYGEGKIHA